MRRLRVTVRDKTQGGNYLIEAALVLLVFIVTLIGIVDLSQVLIIHQALTQRVQAGGRWATVHPFDAAKIQNVVMYNTPSPAGGATPMFGLTSQMVSATQYSASTPEWRIIVQIKDYPFHFFTPGIAGNKTARPIFVDVSGESMGSLN
jgi:hypothetical protein